MFYTQNESLMHEVWGELISVDGGGCAASTIVCDVGTQWVREVGRSWWDTGMVHTDKCECAWMHATACWGESTSWKCMGMAHRVLGGVVAMQVGTTHH